jgi:iron(III) transport system substrate-binding protein
MRLLALIIAAVIALLPITGAAAPAGRVTVLCSPNPAWCDVLRAEFPRATGIQLDFIRLSSGEALARLRAERGNPSFDVWFGGTGDPHLVAAEEGLTELYRPKAWNDIREDLRVATGGKYIPLYAGVLGWALNEPLMKQRGIPQAPHTWDDLTDSRLKGLVAMPNPNSSGTAYTMIATLVQIYGEERAFDLMKRIHRNVSQYTRAGAEPGLLTGRGEVAVGVTFVHDAVDQVLRGFPIGYGAARNGTGYEIGGLSLIKGTPNRQTAVTFIDWSLQPDVQIWAAERAQSYQIQSNAKTPPARVTPRFQDFNVIKYDFVRFGKAAVRDALVARWTREVFPLPR